MKELTIKVLGYASAQAVFDILAGRNHMVHWQESKRHAWHTINYFTEETLKNERQFITECFPNARISVKEK